MNLPRLFEWPLRAALILALPTIACSGYYALGRISDDTGHWALPAVMAYPIALISLVILVSTLLSPQRSGLTRWLSGLCFVLATGFLFLVWR